MKTLDLALTSLLVLTPLIHLLLSPSTKVEESFNLQATHDIIVYGTPVSNVTHRLATSYDHFTFPGAVPRTFTGAVVLAGLSQPIIRALGSFRHAQLVVRGVLGVLNSAALVFFRKRLGDVCGDAVGRWWVVMMVSQFHIMYYLTRTLPNMYAFGLTTVAFALILPSKDPLTTLTRGKQALALLIVATAIFRAELAILLTTTAGYLLITRVMTLRALISTCLVSFLASLAISVPLDSYFWQKPIWPELSGFLFNVIQGSSSEWGVSPWHYYFTSALPRLLLNPLAIPLMLYALFLPGTQRQARSLFIPSALFLAIYSIQPHKEARFIFYVVPPFTAVSALGANYIWTRGSKGIINIILKQALIISVLASLASSAVMLTISSLNYPGGDALTQLYNLAQNDTGVVNIHADVLTCMTGLTLFGQNPSGYPLAHIEPSKAAAISRSPVFVFDKTEDDPRLDTLEFWNQFDYLLMEDPSKALGQWDILGTVHGFGGVEVLRPGQGNVDIEKGSTSAPQDGPVVGVAAYVQVAKEMVRQLTGGWWIGPRMAPRVRIMKRAGQW